MSVWPSDVLNEALTSMVSLAIFVLHKKQKMSLQLLYFLSKQFYPVKYSQVHSHHEGGSSKVDTLGEICQQLVIKRLDPISIATLELSRQL